MARWGGRMSVLRQLFTRNQVKSREIAKRRLQAVLVYDRVDLSSTEMDQIKAEIIEVISRYIEIDKEGADIALTKTLRQNHLVAQVPIVSAIHT